MFVIQATDGDASPTPGASSRNNKGVSFSIKQKETEPAAIDTSRVALPVDPESDDEESQNPGKAQHIDAVLHFGLVLFHLTWDQNEAYFLFFNTSITSLCKSLQFPCCVFLLCHIMIVKHGPKSLNFQFLVFSLAFFNFSC